MGGSDFDPRVTIAVGLLRWLMDYQISEIQILLESKGISISTGEISNLSREFLLHFYCIHRRHMEDMELKEYMLHLDGTGESGSEIVFMAKDKYNVQTRTKNSMLELNTNELLVTVLLLKYSKIISNI